MSFGEFQFWVVFVFVLMATGLFIFSTYVAITGNDHRRRVVVVLILSSLLGSAALVILTVKAHRYYNGAGVKVTLAQSPVLPVQS